MNPSTAVNYWFMRWAREQGVDMEMQPKLYELCRLAFFEGALKVREYQEATRRQAERKGCPRDTNGDGNCGQHYCPNCKKEPSHA